MIRFNNEPAKGMEFTSFRKKENVIDDELLFAVLKFETVLSEITIMNMQMFCLLILSII